MRVLRVAQAPNADARQPAWKVRRNALRGDRPDRVALAAPTGDDGGPAPALPPFDRWRCQASVAPPIICRSALAIEAHRRGASLANTLGMGRVLRLALCSDGCAQPTTSDRRCDIGAQSPVPPPLHARSAHAVAYSIDRRARARRARRSRVRDAPLPGRCFAAPAAVRRAGLPARRASPGPTGKPGNFARRSRADPASGQAPATGCRRPSLNPNPRAQARPRSAHHLPTPAAALPVSACRADRRTQMPRSQEAKRPRSQEAKKPRSQEAKSVLRPVPVSATSSSQVTRPCPQTAPACLRALPRPVLGVRFWLLSSDPFSGALGRAAAASLLARWPGGFCSEVRVERIGCWQTGRCRWQIG